MFWLSPSRGLEGDQGDIEDGWHLVTPDVDTMPSDKYSSRIGVLYHGFCHTILQIFLVGCILDNGDFEGVQIRKSAASPRNTNAFNRLERRVESM